MFKELFRKIFKPKPKQVQQTEVVVVELPLLSMADFEDIYERYLISNIVKISDIAVISLECTKNFNLAKKYKSILRQMQLLLSNNTYKVKSHLCSLFATISLLFGLCSTQSAFIFHSFFGSSLGRIPAIKFI